MWLLTRPKRTSLFSSAVGDVMCPADVDIGLYTGKVNVTGTGRTCAYWKDLPHMYEGSSTEDENFCRNFKNSPLPWCETTHGTQDYCEETVCKGKYGLLFGNSHKFGITFRYHLSTCLFMPPGRMSGGIMFNLVRLSVRRA